MLCELAIRNFALIDEVALSLSPGLTVFTGETGAGKSLLIDALSLLTARGPRGEARADLIRTGSEEAVIEAAFDPPGADIFADLDLPADEPLLLRRHLSLSGRNRVFVCDRMATSATVQRVASSLLEIHGQNEEETLTDPLRQTDLVDRYAGLLPLRREYSEAYGRACRMKNEVAEARRAAAERIQERERLSESLNEVESLALFEGEEEELRIQERLLLNAEKLRGLLSDAVTVLSGGEEDILALFARADRALREVGAIFPEAEEPRRLLEVGKNAAAEASRTVGKLFRQIEGDSSRLEDVCRRLDRISRLVRKYGAGDARGLLREAGRWRERLEAIGDEGTVTRKEEEASREWKTVEELAARLAARRKSSGKSLADRVNSEIGQLGMKKSAFGISWEGRPAGPLGSEEARFLISLPGEEPKPIARIASGGELSRLMLGLRVAVRDADQARPSLIFDEVDAGVGGSVAEAIGRRLAVLGRRQQVLCVTHLAQIASFADHHLSVAKTLVGGRMKITVSALSRHDRVEELARMLGGAAVGQTARRHAEAMIEANCPSKLTKA